MDSAELTEWMAVERIEPFGFHTWDRWFATLSCILANQWRGKADRPVPMETFLRNGGKDPEREPEVLTPEEVRERALLLVKALSGERR